MSWPSPFICLFFLIQLALPSAGDAPAASESEYGALADKITRQGLTESYAYNVLGRLTRLGPRLTGSPGAAAAVELMRQEMTDLGLENVQLEPTVVGRWVRGEVEEARLISSTIGTIPLSICALGGSIATPEGGVRAQVLEVRSFQELRAAGDKARGKIVFFNRPMDPTRSNTFQAYGEAVEQRTRGAIEAARAGGIAALVRSLSLGETDFPHTGLMQYIPGVERLPSAAISTLGANLLSDSLQGDPGLVVYIKTSCANLPSVTSYNVVGELRGAAIPDEIVLLGAHLDSWDLGVGAHDDGAGCAQVIEALRLLKLAGLRPKRTVRSVLFMDEEFGGTGGRDYARSERRKRERHLAALESDRGGFLPIGLGVGGGESVLRKITAWQPFLFPLGISWIKPGGGGVDIGPLAESGTVLLGIVPDSQRYFDAHHCSQDVLSAIHPRELELGAIAMAVLAFLLAEEGL